MVRLLDSVNARDVLRLVLKRSDVEDVISSLNSYLKHNLSTENKNLYRTSVRSGNLSFYSKYYLKGDDVCLDDEDDLELTKLPIIYFYRIRPDLMKKTVYTPEALLASLDWRRELVKWKPFLSGDMNEYLNSNLDEGCTFTAEDIRQHYPGISDLRALTLYRICNSLGEYISLEKLNSGNLTSFDVKVKKGDNVINENNETNKLFKECLGVFKNFVTLSSSRAGAAKLQANRLIYDIFCKCLLSKEDINSVIKNPLSLAKFMYDFDKLTVHSKGFKDNYDAIIKLYPNFRIFILKVFKVNTFLNEDKLFFDLPKISVVEILKKPDVLGTQMANDKEFGTSSNVNTLPKEIDSFVTNVITLFLSNHTNMNGSDWIDSLLFILGRNTTTMKQLQKREKVATKHGDRRMEFIIGDLNNVVLNKTYKHYPDFKGMNIIRLWANNRANRALTLFRMRNFNPGLFSDVPGILPYLRFDFFKALSMQGLSEEEVQSYRTLRLMTEKNSNKTLEDELECERWIFRN
nr:heat shock protein 90 [Crinivirus sp.]